MKLFGLSKPYAIVATGAVGLLLCVLGVKSGENWSSVWVNLGSGFSGAFVTYLLFDTYLGRKEASARAVERLLVALHGDSLGLKNHLLARHPKNIIIQHGVLCGANLAETEWNDLVLVETEFAYCRFDGATLEGCVFERCVFTGVSFKRSNAARCFCRDCSFVACDWADSLWPSEGFVPAETRQIGTPHI